MKATRRRFLTFMGTAAGAAMLPLPILAKQDPQKLYRWQGILLGAETGFQLYHDDGAAAKSITQKAVQEIQRLESIFSLYQANSEVSQLNRLGIFPHASEELIEILTAARHYSQITEGAFDITVQSLWKLYRNTPSPAPQKLQEALHKVDYRHVEISGTTVTLHENTNITLNGIAQGYITDRITELLRTEGITQTLVELGETRTLGTHPDGRNWQIGLRNAVNEMEDVVPLTNRALATSGAYGTPLGHGNHLLNPHTGQSTKHHTSLSILAPTATQADAISTGLSVLEYTKAHKILTRFPEIEARFS